MGINIPEQKFETAILKVTGNGVAEFAEEIPESLNIGLNPETVNSSKFESFSVGQYIQVTFRPTASMRRVVNVRMADNPNKKPTRKIEPTAENVGSGYYMPPQTAKIFETALNIAADTGFYNLLAVGPSGFGKTTLPKIFANAHGMTYYRFDCARVRDPEEWFGTRELKDGETVFLFNRLVDVMEEGNAVIVLDELNRVEAWLHNTLYRLLDSGSAEIHDREIEVGDNVLFVATINQGFQYTGTMTLDEALANRFGMFLDVGPLPEEKEIKILQARTGVGPYSAQSIVNIVNRLRGKDVDFDVSTRVSLNVARIVKTGVEIVDAFEYALGARLEPAQQKNLKDAVRLELT